MVDIDAADNLSKSPREVAGALFAEMELADVPAASKGHFIQAASHLILNRRKPSPSECGSRSAAPLVVGRGGATADKERCKADVEQMEADIARAKVNIGFGPQLSMQFSPRQFCDIRNGILGRGMLIREVLGLKGVEQTDLRDVDKKEVPIGTSEFSIISSPEVSVKVDLTKTVSVVRAAYMMLQNIRVMCCHATSTGWGSRRTRQ